MVVPDPLLVVVVVVVLEVDVWWAVAIDWSSVLLALVLLVSIDLVANVDL